MMLLTSFCRPFAPTEHSNLVDARGFGPIEAPVKEFLISLSIKKTYQGLHHATTDAACEQE